MDNPMSRFWLFTINNPTDIDVEHINGLGCDFLAYQLEKGEEGTPHYQGYVEFRTKRAFSTMKNKFEGRAHLETRKGTARQAFEYCTKLETRIQGPVVKGDISQPEQGRRTDFDDIVAQIKAGATLDEVIVAHPGDYVRYSRGIESLYAHLVRPLEVPPFVAVLHGPPGVGKTRWVYDHYQRDEIGILSRGNCGPWFTGRQDAKVLLIDDFDGWVPETKMLAILDRYRHPIEIKGSFFVPKNSLTIVTSSQPPDKWYPLGTHLEELLRRIHCVICMSAEVVGQVLPTTSGTALDEWYTKSLHAVRDDVVTVVPLPSLGVPTLPSE